MRYFTQCSRLQVPSKTRLWKMQQLYWFHLSDRNSGKSESDSDSSRSRLSRILPYHSVSSRNTPYSHRRAWCVCWRRSFAKCWLARTKAEGLNCLQCGTLFMRTWLNFANFKDKKCNDYTNVWIEVWGLLMVVSTICMSHDGLFSNNWQSEGCTLSTMRVKNPESKEAMPKNLWLNKNF